MNERIELYRKDNAGVELVVIKDVQETTIYGTDVNISIEIHENGQKLHGVFLSLDQFKTIQNIVNKNT